MKPAPDPSLWRSFRFKALCIATLSLALIIAILFGVSSHWLTRERTAAEQQRAEILLKHLAGKLQFALTVQNPDLVQMVLENAFVTREVRAVAVYDQAGHLLAIEPDSSTYNDDFPTVVSAAESQHSPIRRVDGKQDYWLLGTRIEKESNATIDAAPVDFLVIPSEYENEAIGSVWVQWDRAPGAAWLAAFQKRFLAFSALAFVIVGVPTWMLTLYLSQGVSQLLVATQFVQRGNFTYRINSSRADELGDVMRAFDCMVARMAEITEQLQEERARALDASKAKSEFLANMSHELRTPLNAIIGFSELLLEPAFGRVSEKQKSYVVDILESGKHLLSLINDILDLAKIEAGRMHLEAETVDLPHLLNSCTRLISERAARHGLVLVTSIDKGVHYITADQRKLKQLIFNLLSNAVKFTPNGGQIGIRASMHDSAVRICVSDTGIGIREEELAKVFEEFYQVENSQVKRHQGTGLGLSLVKKIAELHGGRVWVESQIDVGSKFYVELPHSPATTQPASDLGKVA